MSEQQYRLEENNQTNELILWEDVRILNVFKNSYDNRKHLNIIVGRLNEYQYTIDKLEQRDYYNQSERYKILCRAIELTANYIDNSDEEHYDFCALVTEFEKELLDDE